MGFTKTSFAFTEEGLVPQIIIFNSQQLEVQPEQGLAYLALFQNVFEANQKSFSMTPPDFFNYLFIFALKSTASFGDINSRVVTQPHPKILGTHGKTRCSRKAQMLILKCAAMMHDDNFQFLYHAKQYCIV